MPNPPSTGPSSNHLSSNHPRLAMTETSPIISPSELVASLRNSAPLGIKYAPGANLESAYLYGANLEGADLKGADLYNANLKSADLYNANLKSANVKGTILERQPSLKEQALEILEINNDVDSQLSAVHYNIIRSALEELPNDN